MAEDADLDVRLARAGTGLRCRLQHLRGGEHRAVELDSPALAFDQGLRADGLVHDRHPRRLWRDLGVRRAAPLQLTLGLRSRSVPRAADSSLPLLWVLALAVRTFIPEWLLTAGSIASCRSVRSRS